MRGRKPTPSAGLGCEDPAVKEKWPLAAKGQSELRAGLGGGEGRSHIPQAQTRLSKAVLQIQMAQTPLPPFREKELIKNRLVEATTSGADLFPQELAPGKVTPLWTPSCSHVEERPSREVLGRSSEMHRGPQQGPACHRGRGSGGSPREGPGQQWDADTCWAEWPTPQTVQFQLESNVMTVESQYNDLVTFLG